MSQPVAQSICEDLLYHIFLHALPFFVSGDGSLINPDTIEPMNFSMVCRSWRAVVQSHPGLWGYIAIFGGTDKSVQAPLHRLLLKWLEYSQTAPLNIFLALYRVNREEDIVSRDIIDTTLSQYFCLEDVEIFIEEPFTEHPFSLQFAPSFVSLRLSFDRYFRNQSPSQFAASLDFTSCPVSAKLQELHIRENVRWLLPEHPSPALHFPSLSHLGIYTGINSNIDDFHTVLLACPNLDCLTVQARHFAQWSSRISSIGVTTLRIASENRNATVSSSTR